MKVAALLALAGVGLSDVCRDLKFVTGGKTEACLYAGSNSAFKIMPFNKAVPPACKGFARECVVTVCGTENQFKQKLVVEGSGRVNSWNYDLFEYDSMKDKSVELSPKVECVNPNSKYCCGMATRLDNNVKKAEYTWPVMSSDAPTGSPSPSPTSAPSRSPTSTDAPSREPSASPTMDVTLAPTMGKPCNQIKNREVCEAAEFCEPRKSKRGKKTAFSCGNVLCKKFRKNFAACSKAPHCIAKMKKGKMKKCGLMK